MSPSKWLKFGNNTVVMDAAMTFEEKKMNKFTDFQHTGSFIENRLSNLYIYDCDNINMAAILILIPLIKLHCANKNYIV